MRIHHIILAIAWLLTIWSASDERRSANPGLAGPAEAGHYEAALNPSIPAQETARVSPSLFGEMRWRSIGPHRASRTRAAAGHPTHPYTFYMGVCNGGVWKTTDAGRTWTPIFDDQPTGSIGTIAVAPSDPRIVYVGSGEALHRPDLATGDGVYKSTDAGRTWTRLGLNDSHQIPALAVDPKNADRIFVAALGHPYGPNEERGIFRSTDGGKSFQKVLYKDENTGGNDVDIDPSNPQVVYATMWEERQGPWENSVWAGTDGGIFKSVDGGTTWKPLTNGLPPVIQANLAISPANPQRIYGLIAAGTAPGSTETRGASGIYRSDDAGESWTRVSNDARPAGRIGGGDLPIPLPHPKDPDTVIIASTVSWKSTDGGKTWTPYKGAPGGEDYQNGWINPDNPDIVLLAADQGAVVTLNGGETWSSWYNQPTAQMYHVSADNAFPYRLCSGQQESGSACVASRGNYGAISVRDWLPVGVDEYGYVAPDPLNPDIVYGGRNVTRFDRRTGQVSGVGPIGGRGGAGGAQGNFRTVRTMPVVFSEVDKRSLFFANNHLWKTIDGGQNWKQISPDLTRKTWVTPKSVGKYRDLASAQSSPRGVIYTVAPSYQDINRIWVGTDDGLIHVTSDGGVTWKDITPPSLEAWAKVSIIDAGRFDPLTAYAAINTLRLDDLRPHILRTHDGGKTWTEIVNGIPAGETVNAVREDPKRKGLLFAATERTVYVSFDDGANWQSLRLNLPISSVRDVIVKDDDLAIGMHGRGFWILDDITPLRQIGADTAGQRRSALQADVRVESALEHQHGHALARRGTDVFQSARWRHHQLLPEVTCGWTSHARDPAEGRPARSAVLQCRSSDAHSTGGRSACSALLVPFASEAVRRARDASLRVGHALSATRRRRRWRPRRFAYPGDSLQQRAGAGDTVGQSWHLHGEADRRWKEFHAAYSGEAGPAREDASPDDESRLQCDQHDLLRRGGCF